MILTTVLSENEAIKNSYSFYLIAFENKYEPIWES